MGWLRKRFGEGTTWAGIAATAQAGANLIPAWAVYFHAITLAATSIAVATPEK